MSRMTELRTWYQSLQQREQKILLTGAVALGVLLVYAALLHPYISSKHALQEDVVERQQLLT
jgi:type II secretory pathway component PulM